MQYEESKEPSDEELFTDDMFDALDEAYDADAEKRRQEYNIGQNNVEEGMADMIESDRFAEELFPEDNTSEA
jgi:hypothetical protein